MMAIAMEVGWRGSELGSPSFSHLKHKAPSANNSNMTSSSSWGGADPQKLLQLMMGQIQEESRPTLDLFGKKPSSSVAEKDDESRNDEFLELDPDLPLPSGWEKCLDLKSGKVYYVNRHSGLESRSDPRKQQASSSSVIPEATITSESPRTRDFFGSKESESEKLGELTSTTRSLPSFSDRGIDKEREDGGESTSFFSNGKRDRWGAGHDGWLCSSSSLADRLQNEVGGAENGLDLKLNLQGKTQQSSVCTLEKVEMALMRSEKMLGKRVASTSQSPPTQADQLLRSNHTAAHVSSSPSTSSSSTSTSSRPPLGGHQLLEKENQNSNKRSATAVASPVVLANEGESAKEMVMVGCCKNCAMFVMLSKSSPSCPRCGTSAALDFSSPLPSSKRAKFENDRRD
ncbi:hypothetical protein R1flu_019617 [Riccia fluitans]|uniref:WW domain-containing protein n=1 Tax=Riccia fluitans TaxID=41844 RepID=A0ABD1ZMN4_9MARC